MEIPLTDGELDRLEQQAREYWAAIQAVDYDSAYIVASTCENPALLCMFVAGVANETVAAIEEQLDDALDRVDELLEERVC